MRRTAAALGVVVWATGCGGSSAPTTPSSNSPSSSSPATVEAYATEVIGFFTAHSYYTHTIDWTNVQNQANQAALAGKSKVDTVTLILALINDNHSFYVTTAGSLVFPYNTSDCIANAPVPPLFAAPADIGYVQVPSEPAPNGPPNPQAAQTYAQNLQKQVQAADGSGLVGWVVDARQDGGGGLYEQMAGVGAILGNGIAGFFIDADGNSTPWSYENGVALYSSSPQITVQNYLLQNPSPRVAVLMDNRTNSAGEAVVISFIGRANVRTFGYQTCGRTTGNSEYTLSDGATLGIMDTLEADRTNHRYGGPIVPDESFTDPDALRSRVVDWIHTGQ